MFVQIIEGRTSDAEGLLAQGDRWQEEVRPGAVGYLGVTSGVAADGRTIAIVRFESEEAARANSERPEQSAWFEEMQKYFDGEPTFTESSDVTELLKGGSNDAGFVQIMKSTGVDRAQMERLDASFDQFAEHRPDLIGSVRIWTGPDSCVEAAYFTSEADARKGEQTELPEEVQAQMAEFEAMMANTEFIDLPNPQLR
jgi:hypothetical protein